MPKVVEPAERDLHDQQNCESRHRLLHGVEHAVVVKEVAEQRVPYRHRETKPAVAQVVMSNAGPPRQEPRRQLEAPGSVPPAGPRKAIALDVVPDAVEAKRSAAHVELETHAKPE